MPALHFASVIAAPVELCFDVARDIDFHKRSTGKTREVAVAGVTSGLIGPGEAVTWEATHLGVRQWLTSRIVEYDRPRHFADAQVQGAFHSFVHHHWFEAMDAGTTRMSEEFRYRSPLGPLGRMADSLFLEAYMRRFLETRHRLVGEEAERRFRSGG